jgi:hypothetical protein
LRQELWATGARSSGETFASVTNDRRSALRWNSIRRSTAFEHMMGKRVMTFSRTAR